MSAQTALFWAVLGIALVGLVAALVWQWKYDTEHDWVERIARAVFVAMQLTIWGNVVAFMILDTWLNFDFGGAR